MKRERIKVIMVVLPGAFRTQSPKGKDANDWLRAGKLEVLVSGMLQRTGRGRDLSSHAGEVVSDDLWQRLQVMAWKDWRIVGRQVDAGWRVERYQTLGYVD